MKRKKEGEEWTGRISYQGHDEEIEDPTTVDKKIEEGTIYKRIITKSGWLSYRIFKVSLISPAIISYVCLFVPSAQNEMAGVGVGISDELISLEIASPEVPDLTLIDLPGIARVAVKGQPENIGDQVS